MLRPPPRVYATVRRDGSGEISFNGTNTVVKGDTLQEAGSLAVAMVAQKAAQWGKPLRMTAQSPIDTRVLMVHPDGHLTEAKDRWWRPGLLITAGLGVTGLGLAIWLWLGPAIASNDQTKNHYPTTTPQTTQPAQPAQLVLPDGSTMPPDSDEFGRILPTNRPTTPQPLNSPKPTPTVTVTIATQNSSDPAVPADESTITAAETMPPSPTAMVTITATVTTQPAAQASSTTPTQNQTSDQAEEMVRQPAKQSDPRSVQAPRPDAAIVEID